MLGQHSNQGFNFRLCNNDQNFWRLNITYQEEKEKAKEGKRTGRKRERERERERERGGERECGERQEFRILF